MTEQRWRFLYAFVGLVLLIGLTLGTGTTVDLSLSTGLWVEATVWILLGAFVLEPRFTGAPTAATNGIATIFVFLGTDTERFTGWWMVLLLAAILALVLVTVPYVVATGSERASRRNRQFSRIGTRLGSWRSLPVGVLALALVSFQQPYSDAWFISATLLLYTFGLATFEPHRMWPELFGGAFGSSELTVARLCPPCEVLVTGSAVATLDEGQLVRFSQANASADGLVLGTTIDGGVRVRRVLVPDLYSVVGIDGGWPEIRRVAETAESGIASLQDELRTGGTSVAGALAEGSAIRDAHVELATQVGVSVGQVLWTSSTRGKTYWQVADAEIARTTWGGDTRRVVRAHVVQIGTWAPESLGFVASIDSPQIADVLLAGDVGAPELPPLAPYHYVLGELPGSNFPIIVDLSQMSRHHFALLGTTGTGKTHLAFGLVNAFADYGIKVICVDSTGQYAVAFPPGTAAQIAKGSVSTFLSGSENIAVYSPDVARDSIAEGKELATNLFNWARGQPTLQPSDPARVVLLFEEAQNYVPEGFVVESFKRKEMAQDTSRLVMESRKFGLGFGLISQRTAMVTKSALSQCGTVVAFQAVDQTNLDYLAGLCGLTLARGIPTLPHRTAVILGRGMTSSSPVIVRTSDARVQVA